MALLRCRLCKGNNFSDVLDLGYQYLASRFPRSKEESVPREQLILVLCEDCSLLQLKHTVPPDEMYQHEYGYMSGISCTMREHLRRYNEFLRTIVPLNPEDRVLDIGSNDCTFLNFYPECNKTGCDPTGLQFSKYYTGVTLVPDYFGSTTIKGTFKIITSISMFYDLPDPVSFARDVFNCLEPEGIWSFEQSYSKMMLEKNSLDTICHEHLEYYNLKNILDIVTLASMKIIHASYNECNGGSVRVVAAKMGSKHEELNIDGLLQEEKHLYDKQTYKDWLLRCKTEVDRLRDTVTLLKDNNKTIYLCGASTKGNTLLQYAGIDRTVIDYAVERNTDKIGRYTPGSLIEIIGEYRIKEPDYMIVLPWHFREEIIKRETKFLEGGGCLIFPLPKLEMYCTKRKILLLGGSGQIGKYVIQDYSDCALFSMGRTRVPGTINSLHSVLDYSRLEGLIQILQPETIINLASVTNAESGIANPMETLEVNGILVCRLCDIVYRSGLKSKLINTSSIEVYKDGKSVIVKEDDVRYNGTHPYSIAKILALQMSNFYRTRGVLVVSLLLFTTESKYRDKYFLMKKVSEHIKSLKTGVLNLLTLGNVSSTRVLTHSSDVSRAIRLVDEKSKSGNYLCCSDNVLTVMTLILKMFEQSGLVVVLLGDKLMYKGVPVVEFTNKERYPDCNITGESTKLKELGWVPQYSLEDIINDFDTE